MRDAAIAGDTHPTPAIPAAAGGWRRKLPARALLVVGGAILLLLVVAQIALPGLGEGAIEDRLTENGGTAEVSLSALPAARLLWGSGDRIAVDATGIELDLTEERRVFQNLDRFDEVEITLVGATAGPMKLDSFALTREGDEPYRVRADGSASVSDLARFGIDRAGLPGSGIVGDILDFTGIAGADVPIELDMQLASDDGRIRVVEGGGTVAGLPTGPLAELLTAAIVVRL
ncbi:MAG TPA: hypothetical protein VIL04_01600 [Solirubrobacterales bacterium]|mgnify:CR=1 FL=1|jgi:hypothetical protein